MVRSERGVSRIGKSRGKDGRIIRFINGDGGGVTFRKSWSARRRSLGGKAGGFGKRSHSCRICNRRRGGGVGRTLQYICKGGGGGLRGMSVIGRVDANAGCPIEKPSPFRRRFLKLGSVENSRACSKSGRGDEDTSSSVRKRDAQTKTHCPRLFQNGTQRRRFIVVRSIMGRSDED